jgi:hypothetical protein
MTGFIDISSPMDWGEKIDMKTDIMHSRIHTASSESTARLKGFTREE